MSKTEQKLRVIRQFLEENADPGIVKKYSRYFKEGYKGFGIEQKKMENQREAWIKQWKDEMSLDECLGLGDRLVAAGIYEETALAVWLAAAYKGSYDINTFHRVGRWLENGIDNWAGTDMLSMLVLEHFLVNGIAGIDDFAEWTNSPSEWKRRAVPVTFINLIKKGTHPNDMIPKIDQLMTDDSLYVQKGMGWFLREAWKKHPEAVEEFLLKWKDTSPRTIFQYATEKMSKENKQRFKKSKK